jgi:hypothetical protein
LENPLKEALRIPDFEDLKPALAAKKEDCNEGNKKNNEHYD